MDHRTAIAEKGFTVVNDVFNTAAVEALIACIENTDTAKATFRRTKDLFAIRQFFKEVPVSLPLVFIPALHQVIDALFGHGYHVVKSIYFDKPAGSNWFVSYHQDLTISVKEKVVMEGYGPWTVKQDQYAVQPPLQILEDNFTIRIHLDDTDENNGALRVIPGSHRKGIYRPETIDWQNEVEETCTVQKGGLMIMRPLLLHASSRTNNQQPRRVIHIECSRTELPLPLRWSEKVNLPG